MTDLIALAKQAEMKTSSTLPDVYLFNPTTLQAFADLIAQREREAIAELFPQPHQEYFGTEIQDSIRARGTT